MNTAAAEKKNGHSKTEPINGKPMLKNGIDTEKGAETMDKIIKEADKAKLLPEHTETKEVKPLSVEEKKDRINKLMLLSEKHDELKDKYKELEQFKISHNSDQAKVIITDNAGKSFQSHNPEAIKLMIDFCKLSIQTKISDVERQIEL